MTRELFNTNTSPARRYSKTSRKIRCSTRPLARATPANAIHHVGRGMLGDQFGRQDKVKISGSHRDLIVAGDGLENRTTFLALIPTKMGVVDNF
jgi:hypothetical protein